jgi:hypothetical protein
MAVRLPVILKGFTGSTDMKKAETRLFIGFLGLYRTLPVLHLVESRGIEPLTSSLRTKRSTN